MKSLKLRIDDFKSMVKRVKEQSNYIAKLEKANKFLNDQVKKIKEMNK